MLTIQHWPLDRFIEYARNPRKNDHAVPAIAAAINEFGFRVPILAKSDGLVVDGHLRLKAARQLGLETVPVALADDLTDTQVKAFRLSVNKIAELADWDEDLLRLELQDLSALDFDLSLVGFDGEELARLLDGNQDQDDQPDTPPESSAKEIDPDDYQMGHRCPRCGFEFDSDND